MGSYNIVHTVELDKFLNSSSGAVGRHLFKQATKIKIAAKAQVGVKTGALRASIHMRHSREPQGQSIRIGSMMHHAYMHHEGTKPHLIVPNSRQVLRFTRGSGVVFAHSVRHPGTKPNRYLSDQLRIIK